MMKYRNFSSWPLNQYTNDGRNIMIPPQALTSEINPVIQNTQIFRNAGLFADDCRFGCGDMPSKLAMSGGKMSADGRITGKDILGTITTGFNFWASSQQNKADAEAAAKAAEIERLRLQQEAQKTKQQQEKVSVAKAYAVPIAIGAAVLIAGIAAYFIFKKKKV